eukprot:4354357-Alexandrium_andersonii.AAC.1
MNQTALDPPQLEQTSPRNMWVCKGAARLSKQGEQAFRELRQDTEEHSGENGGSGTKRQKR